METDESLGEMLRKIRLSLRFGIREFCDKYEIDFIVWSGVERGLIVPSYEDMGMLCNKMAIDTDIVDWRRRDDILRDVFKKAQTARPLIKQVSKDAVILIHGIPVQDDNLPAFVNASAMNVINRYHDHGLFISQNSDQGE